MLESGNPAQLGASLVRGGVNFSLWSGSAETVDLCLFDERGNQVACHPMPARHNRVWHGFLPGCEAGQRYGYRVHGPWLPEDGLRHNPAKLLVDPYARRLDGAFRWHPHVFDYDPAYTGGSPSMALRNLGTRRCPLLASTLVATASCIGVASM